jgi:hypothetical protein
MATIIRLPTELLYHILGSLNPFDLESVAKTFNKTLYDSARLLLEPHKAWLANARHMNARFPPLHDSRFMPMYPGHIRPLLAEEAAHDELPRAKYKPMGLDPNGGPYIRSSPCDLRSYMNLDGTFGWLHALENRIADDQAPHIGREGDKAVADGDEIDSLVKDAERLGLTLPPGFEVFLRSNRLHHRIPSSRAWYFQLSPLLSCPSLVGDGLGGHLVRFHCDQQYCSLAYLYLDTSGHHCVLLSSVDAYATYEDDQALADGGGDNGEYNPPMDKRDFFLCGLTFEEYLAEWYYDELLYFKAKPSRGLQDFVQHVYRSPAEVEHMREYSESITAMKFFSLLTFVRL